MKECERENEKKKYKYCTEYMLCDRSEVYKAYTENKVSKMRIIEKRFFIKVIVSIYI